MLITQGIQVKITLSNCAKSHIYYISRTQKRKRHVILKGLNRYFHDNEDIVKLDNPNSIHALNWFEEESHVERL